MNLPLEEVKYFGVYSIVICTTVPLYLMYKWKADKATTLSRHVAQDKQTYLIFAIGSVVWQALFLAFMLGWFLPTFKLGTVLAMIITIGTACQLISAWIPDTAGLSSKVHRVAAWTMGVVMYIFTVWMCLSPSITGFARPFSLMALLLMTGLLLNLLNYTKTSSRALMLQSFYIGLFYATVLVVGYI